MALQDVPPEDHAAPDRSLKRKQRAVKQTKKRPSRKKTATAALVARPECLMIAGEGSCPKGKTRQVNGLQ
jgi:hypothetical protein